MPITEATYPINFEKEHRYQFEAKSPAGPHVVVSGNTWGLGTLGTNDDTFEDYEVRLIVGPWWKDVQNVVPFVTINGFMNDDWDEVDAAGWEVTDLTWDTVGGDQAPHLDEERIRLKFILRVRGEGSAVIRTAYHFFARGRQLGAEGLGSP